MKYCRVFETESNYTDFVNGSDYVTPNLCVIRSTGGTKCKPYIPLVEINIIISINENGYGNFTNEQVELIRKYCFSFSESFSGLDGITPDDFVIIINSILVEGVSWYIYNGITYIQLIGYNNSFLAAIAIEENQIILNEIEFR